MGAALKLLWLKREKREESSSWGVEKPSHDKTNLERGRIGRQGAQELREGQTRNRLKGKRPRVECQLLKVL